MKKIIMFFVLVLSSQYLSASWSGNAKITMVYPHPQNTDGVVYFKFDNMANHADCENDLFIALKRDNTMFTELYAMLLSANLADKNVQYFLSNTDCDVGKYPVMYVARIVD